MGPAWLGLRLFNLTNKKMKNLKMKDQKWIFAILALFLSTSMVKSQTCPTNSCSTSACEYVCNGGFNFYSSPPTSSGTGQITRACGWGIAYPFPNNGGDYYHTTATFASKVQIPCNGEGYENFNLDDGYAGLLGKPLANASPARKHAIETLLKSPLSAGNYEISFYLSLGDESEYNTMNCFGVEFPGYSGQMIINPTASTTSVTTNGWTKFTVNYTSIGGETVLRIGFLNTPVGSDMVATGVPSTTCPGQQITQPLILSYYFLDNVSIKELISPPTISVSNSSPCVGSTFTLSAQGPTSPGTYTWMPGNLSGSSIAIPAPAAATTYTVYFTDANGCVSSSSIVVTPNTNCCLNPLVSTYPSMILDNVTFVPPGTPGAVLPTNFAFGNSYTGPVILPTGGLPSGAYTVRGTLTINDPTRTTVFTGCDIIFDDCAQFDQLTPLTIDGSYLHACNMWQGLGSKNYLKVTNSIIEDAWDAIIIIGLNAHPGLLVDNCVFNKNKYGIVLAGATNFNTSSPNNFKITGTIFTCKAIASYVGNYAIPLNYNFTSTLIGANNTVRGTFTTMNGGCSIPKTRSEMGILTLASSVSDGNFFNIGNTSGGTNYFSYLNYGIYNSGTMIHVVKSNFQQIMNSMGNSGIAGIVHDGSVAKTVTNIGDLNSSVKSCKFQVSEIGIKAFRGGSLNVYSSNFNTGLNSSIGIDIQNWNDPSGSVNVLQNSFNTSSNTDLQAITNNSIKLIMQGNVSVGNGLYNVKIQEAGSPNALYRIDGNNFSDRQSGIFLNGVLNANITDNTINIANNTSNGSLFTTGIANYNSKNCLYSGNIIGSVNPNNNNSRWHVSGINTVDGNGNTYCNNTISRVGHCLGYQFKCAPANIYSNSFNVAAPTGITGISLDNSAQTGPIGVLSGSTWYASENIFGNLTAGLYAQGGSNSAGINVYYNGTPPSSSAVAGSFAYAPTAAGLIPGGPVCPSATFRLNNQNQYPAAYEISAQNYLKEEYYLARTFEQYRHILSDSIMDACTKSNIGQFFVEDSLMQLYVTTKNMTFMNSAIAINASIVPLNPIETNQIEFNTIFQAHLLNDSIAMIGYIEQLRTLAQKCPQTDGNVVYLARAVLSAYDATAYVNECERSATPSSDPSIGQNLVHLYPNPTSNEIFANADVDGLKMEVYNLVGIKVASHILVSGANRIDVSSLSSGTYFFKILDATGMLKTEKVVLTRE